MISVSKPTDSLVVFLDGAVTTNELHCFATYSYVNKPMNQLHLHRDKSVVKTAGITAVTFVSVVEQYVGANVETVNIYNADTESAVVNIGYNNGIEVFILKRMLLQPNSSMAYSGGEWGTSGEASVVVTPGVVNVTTTDAALIASVPVTAGTIVRYPAPDATVHNTDNSYTASVVSGGDLELVDETITITDENDNVLQVLNFPIYENQVIDLSSFCPAGGSVGATIMRTGATTVYRTGDDASTSSEGRAADFLTLDAVNPFSNLFRFTDELGTQTFANNIVIDWSTYNGTTVLGYYRKLLFTGAVFNFTWDDAIDLALTHSIGTFTTGWRLWNKKELENIVNLEDANGFGYFPFTNPDGQLVAQPIWTSSTLKISTTQAWFTQFYGSVGYQAKTGTKRVIAVRTFTVTGTTLS